MAVGGTRNNGRDRAASGGRFHDSPHVEVALAMPFRAVCGKCGARRIDQQIGLEPTPDDYVRTLVQVFREVWRVLKPDGSLWLNLGDSYAAGKAGRTDYGTGDPTSTLSLSRNGLPGNTRPGPVIQRSAPEGLKPKDLIGIPWRVAFALQAEGWYLRSDIIWSKPNPMPESVTDRPTKAHEYLFLLAKSQRYYYDADAIAEPLSPTTSRLNGLRPSEKRGGFYHPGEYGRSGAQHGRELHWKPEDGRNKRSVWTVATQSYAEAHFATWPPKLIEPCILAGSRPGDLVLDPFIGSGTTGQVCERLGRRWVGCDLTYQHLAKTRTAQRGLRFIVDEASA